MRSRCMLSADVVESEDFLALTLEAQTLYLHIVMESELTGRVRGAKRFARSYGFGSDVLAELADAGFIIEVGGQWYDRYAWVNAKFSSRLAARFENFEEVKNGMLPFEGEVCRSAYALQRRQNDAEATPQRRHSDATAASNCTPNTTPTPTPTPTPIPTCHAASQEEGIDEGQRAQEQGRPTQCRECGEVAYYQLTDKGTTTHCPHCGAEYSTQRGRVR